MVKVSIIIPTYRAGGIDVLFGGLKNQTMRDYELILVDDLYSWRKDEVKRYAEQSDIPLVHFQPPKSDKPFACGHAVNWGLRWAEGDYVMVGTDFFWLEPDCLERHLKIQKPEGRVTVGYMHHYVSPKLGDLNGKLTVFDCLHEERPEVLELPDRRFHQLIPASDLGEDYSRFAFHFHLSNYSVLPNELIPLHACLTLNGYDERLDIGHGFNDDNLIFRLVNFLNYEFVLDKKNVSYHVTHPWSRKTQHPMQTTTHYTILNSILQGFAGIKASNGFDLFQERCRVRYEKWLMDTGGREKPPLKSTYQQPAQQRRLKWIEAQCEGAKSILEVGCSEGYVLRKVGRNAEQLAGIDINQAVIERNKKRYSAISWHHGDVTKGLPFPNDSYEIVFETEVLEHVSWVEAASLIMDGLRVASKKLLITIPNATRPNYNRRYVESEHHQWALTKARLYGLSLIFHTGLWTPKPNYALRVLYSIDDDFVYFRLEKIEIEKEDEVMKRAVMLKEMKEKEVEEIRREKL